MCSPFFIVAELNPDKLVKSFNKHLSINHFALYLLNYLVWPNYPKNY